MFDPLRKITNLASIEGYPKNIFILTDGGVENTSSCVKLCGKVSNHSRVHAFGVGEGVSKELIVGTSLYGRGYYSIIETNTEGRIEEEVVKALELVSKPSF